MANILFLQSDLKDPFDFYKKMLESNPIYYDTSNRIWGVYSAKACREILNISSVSIPSFVTHPDASEQTKFVMRHLPRIANSPQHESLRLISLRLMQSMRELDVPSLLHLLIGEPKMPAKFDWVADVAMKLPVLSLLKGFGFAATQLEDIVSKMPNIVRIMAPIISSDEMRKVNRSLEHVFTICSSHIKHTQSKSETEIYSPNLIGLLIQSYDATRGLLSNAMLQTLRDKNPYGNSLPYYQHIVSDTLRFDPPVHNTRRVVNENLNIQQQTFKQGDHVLVVLASASMQDEGLLSFGDGVHRCMADHFTIDLTTQALHYLFNKYRHIELLEKEITYEPRVNVRIPIRMNLIVR
jgi:cytochrome P450